MYKISWSHKILNCVIQREIAKNQWKKAFFGGSVGSVAVSSELHVAPHKKGKNKIQLRRKIFNAPVSKRNSCPFSSNIGIFVNYINNHTK